MSVSYSRTSSSACSYAFEQSVWRYVADFASTTLLVHHGAGWCGHVTFPSSPDALDENAENDEEEDDAKGAGEADEDDEAEGEMRVWCLVLATRLSDSKEIQPTMLI